MGKFKDKTIEQMNIDESIMLIKKDEYESVLEYVEQMAIDHLNNMDDEPRNYNTRALAEYLMEVLAENMVHSLNSNDWQHNSGGVE